MTHKIGRIRRRARRAGPAAGRGNGSAVRRAMQAGNVQAKLKVGPQNDAYEREADRVAAHVMAGQSVEGVSAMGPEQGQRKCDECEAEDAQRAPQIQRMEVETEEEEALQAKRLGGDLQLKSEEEEEVQAKAHLGAVQRQDEDEGEEIQAKAKPDGSFTASATTSAQVAGLKGAGQPLPTSTRAYFEARFGADFSDVRVHTDARAQKAAQSLNARAFTTGRDVVFGTGEYAPSSHSGGTLLAHELTHVIQQRGYKEKSEGQVSAAAIQPWRLGKAPVPVEGWDVVPQGQPKGEEDHRDKLNAARGIVRGLLKNKNCISYFKNACEGQSASPLKDAFEKSRVYFTDSKDLSVGKNVSGSGNIAYNRRAIDKGPKFLAATLLHETYHVCAPTIGIKAREINAEDAVQACGVHVPYLISIYPMTASVGSTVNISAGNLSSTQGSNDRVELNGVSCPVQRWAFGQNGSSLVTITVMIPQGAKTGAMRIINNDVASDPAMFAVV